MAFYSSLQLRKQAHDRTADPPFQEGTKRVTLPSSALTEEWTHHWSSPPTIHDARALPQIRHDHTAGIWKYLPPLCASQSSAGPDPRRDFSEALGPGGLCSGAIQGQIMLFAPS